MTIKVQCVRARVCVFRSVLCGDQSFLIRFCYIHIFIDKIKTNRLFQIVVTLTTSLGQNLIDLLSADFRTGIRRARNMEQ